jgi:hypothetical protein
MTVVGSWHTGFPVELVQLELATGADLETIAMEAA